MWDDSDTIFWPTDASVELVRTNNFVAWLSCFRVVPIGVRFFFHFRRRGLLPAAQRSFPPDRSYERPQLDLELAVRYADGRFACARPDDTSNETEGADLGDALCLSFGGGSMAPNHIDREAFLSPLPINGLIAWTVKSEELGVSEVSTHQDSTPLLQVATRATSLWAT